MRQRATPAELATAYHMWSEGARVADIAAAVGRNQAWVYNQAQDRKWGRRRPQKGSPGRKYANLEQDARAEGAARDRQLYGALIDDVKFLRSRDWGIHRDGTRIIVGNRPMEPESIRALAERERRISTWGGSMRTTVDANIDLTDLDTWELAEALVRVAGDHEAAYRCVERVDVSRDRRPDYNFSGNAEQEHAAEIRALRAEVKVALDLIDRGRIEEGMHALRLFGADEMRLTEWQAIKDGKHPFLKLVAA